MNTYFDINHIFLQHFSLVKHFISLNHLLNTQIYFQYSVLYFHIVIMHNIDYMTFLLNLVWNDHWSKVE